MKRWGWVAAVFLAALWIFPTSSRAQHAGHGSMAGGAMKMDTKEVLVDGTRVVFQVMGNEEHRTMLKEMKMKDDIEPGTTHNISVTLKDAKTQKEITNAQVNMKVVDPKGKDQIKPMKFEEMMKTYGAYFNMREKGNYQVMILFKIGSEKKTAGIYYELK